MKIIDWKKKGNLVRFYLGADNCEDYWGDDWDDAPYDCNAGEVYDEYVTGVCDVVFPYDWLVFEPCETTHRWSHPNCEWCKEDMKKRKLPCIVAALRTDEDGWDPGYDTYAPDASGRVKKFYFGDHMKPTQKIVIVGDDRILYGEPTFYVGSQFLEDKNGSIS